MTTIKVNNQIITVANKSVENKMEFLDLSKKYDDGSLNLALECMNNMYYEAISTENYNYINDINLYLELGIESFMSLEDGNDNFKTKAKQTLSNILKKLKEIFHKVITSIVKFAKMMVQAFVSLIKKIKQFFVKERFEFENVSVENISDNDPKKLIKAIKECNKDKNYISLYLTSSTGKKNRIAISVADLAEILFPESELSKETLIIPNLNKIAKTSDSDFDIPGKSAMALELMERQFVRKVQENDDIDEIISKLNSSIQSFNSNDLGLKLIYDKSELSTFTSAKGFAEYAKSVLFDNEAKAVQSLSDRISVLSDNYNKVLTIIENFISNLESMISNNSSENTISACNKVVKCLNAYRSKLQEYVKIPFEVSKFVYRSQSELNRRLTINNGLLKILKGNPQIDAMNVSSDKKGRSKLVKLPNMGAQTYAVKFDLHVSSRNLNQKDLSFIKHIKDTYASGLIIDFGEMKEKEPQSIDKLRSIILNNTEIQTKTDDLSVYSMNMSSGGGDGGINISGYLVSGNKNLINMENVDIIYHTSRIKGIKELIPSGASGTSGQGLMFGSKRIYGSLEYPVMPNGMDFMKFHNFLKFAFVAMNLKYKSLLKTTKDKKRALMQATNAYSDKDLKMVGSFFNYTVYIIHKSDVDAVGGKIFADKEHQESKKLSDVATGAKANAVFIETDKPIKCEEDTAKNAKLDKIRSAAKELYDGLTELGYTENDVKTV